MQHIIDFMDIDYSPPAQQGKRTQVFTANLVKTGSILPYYLNGKIVWMWKDPAHWYTQDVVDQAENLILCKGHQSPDWSHEAAIGLIRDVKLENPYVAGTCSIFSPYALTSIHEGVKQLSPDAVVDVIPIQREIDGQWVDYAQRNPRLDHIAVVEKGRQGEELTLVLQNIQDTGLTLDATAFALTLEQAKQTIVIHDHQGKPMKTAAELQAELTIVTTELGTVTSQLTQVKDEATTVRATLEATQAELAELKKVNVTDEAVRVATEGMALMTAAQSVGVTVSMKDCVEAPLGVYRQIKDAIAPGSATVSDEMLPVFCAGLLASRTNSTPAAATASPTTVATTNVADSADVAAAKPFSLADALVMGAAASTTTTDVVVQDVADTNKPAKFKLPNTLAGIKAPSIVIA